MLVTICGCCWLNSVVGDRNGKNCHQDPIAVTNTFNPQHSSPTSMYKCNWSDKLSWKKQLLQLYYRNDHLVIQGSQQSMFSIQNNRLMCTFPCKGLSLVSFTAQVCPSLSSNPAVKQWNQAWKSARILTNIFVFKYEADIDVIACLWALVIHFLKRLNFTSILPFMKFRDFWKSQVTL